MDTKLKFRKPLSFALVTMFYLTSNSGIIAQKQHISGLRNFKITIEKTDKGIKLHSSQGSSWVDLSFTLTNDRPQAIDEYGMTTPGQVNSDKDPKLADYLFTLTRTKDGMSLKGIEGTAWKELNFTLRDNRTVSIDQAGMAD